MLGGRRDHPEAESLGWTVTDLQKRFSQFASHASCNQEDACGLEQGLDDEAEPVIAQGEALVLQNPGVGALDRPAPLAQTRPVRLAALVDVGLGPELAAQ